MAEIFLMEDSAPLRRIVTRYLRDAGHNVTAFDNGMISSDAGMLHHADILVTDLSMPGVDGRQVIQNVDELYPALPVVLISGVERFKDPVLDKLDGYLHKPFEEEELLNLIEGLLEKSGQPVLEIEPDIESRFASIRAQDCPSTTSRDRDSMPLAALCSVQPDSLRARAWERIRRLFSRR